MKAVDSMIIHSTATIIIEDPRLPRGVRHLHLSGTMTDVATVASIGFQSTQENQASTREPFSFKAWSTGTERRGKTLAKIVRLATEFMFWVQSVSAEPSGLK